VIKLSLHGEELLSDMNLEGRVTMEVHVIPRPENLDADSKSSSAASGLAAATAPKSLAAVF
jgi:hypothetical protein